MCLGMPASVVEPVDVSSQRMLVDVQGKQQQVSAAMLMSESTEPPQPGDWVLVHMGFALSRMDESEARAVLESLDELTDLYADQLHVHASASEVQRSSHTFP